MGKTLLCGLAVLLPGPLKRTLLRRLLGWEIAPSAEIGLSLFQNVGHVRLGPGARVGHFNVFRNLRLLDLGAEAAIGQWNWVSAAEVLVRGTGGDGGRLVLGRGAAITARHYLDCSGGISVGAFTSSPGCDPPS